MAPRAEDDFLEIGAGAGQLTVPLAARGPRSVLAVEVDPILAERLGRALAGAEPSAEVVTVLHADFLALDVAEVLKARDLGRMRVVGNLPYSVASPILLRLLAHRSRIQDMTLLFQREVAQRLRARPGTKAYGALTVLAQQATRIRSLFRISPEAFWPRPKVASELLRFEPRGADELPVGGDRLFRALVKGLFSHRRKNISNNLKYLKSTDVSREELEEGLRALDIDPAWRAETLTVQQFAALSHFCASRR